MEILPSFIEIKGKSTNLHFDAICYQLISFTPRFTDGSNLRLLQKF